MRTILVDSVCTSMWLSLFLYPHGLLLCLQVILFVSACDSLCFCARAQIIILVCVIVHNTVSVFALVGSVCEGNSHCFSVFVQVIIVVLTP